MKMLPLSTLVSRSLVVVLAVVAAPPQIPAVLLPRLVVAVALVAVALVVEAEVSAGWLPLAV